ncbi:Siphovirus-type tail component [uncultured Caudovirales phage]|uniref:Siphovirus-type tail component n=1 Tax=uncultured Caudovirales phage TaxID=2100421 RepID=A0A6J5NHL8_9CAUD|nr:Siphovirus-type tail component [uncultured Caudovirales phage]
MKLEFIRGSAGWQFNVENGGYSGASMYVTGAINWGIAPITRITQRGPFQDGDTDIDYRINPRVINLPIVVPSSSYDEMMNNREKVSAMFRPGNDTATIRHTLNENAIPAFQIVRCIDVKIAGASMDTSQTDFNVRAVIQLRAADPTWYEPKQNPAQLSSTQYGTPTPYPKTYPVPYGASSINNNYPLAYYGTAVSYPIIQCIGPLTDLVIADGLGHQIVFDDPIPAGAIWLIDLSAGRKTVTDSNGVNKFSSLDISSDLVGWGLYPESTFLGGYQVISVSATGTNSNSMVNMFYNVRYVGI